MCQTSQGMSFPPESAAPGSAHTHTQRERERERERERWGCSWTAMCLRTRVPHFTFAPWKGSFPVVHTPILDNWVLESFSPGRLSTCVCSSRLPTSLQYILPICTWGITMNETHLSISPLLLSLGEKGYSVKVLTSSSPPTCVSTWAVDNCFTANQGARFLMLSHERQNTSSHHFDVVATSTKNKLFVHIFRCLGVIVSAVVWTENQTTDLKEHMVQVDPALSEQTIQSKNVRTNQISNQACHSVLVKIVFTRWISHCWFYSLLPREKFSKKLIWISIFSFFW